MSDFFTSRASNGLVALATCFLAPPLNALAAEAGPPALMLPNVYAPSVAQDLSAYWVSEKFDGIRAYWDGWRLLTRNGKRIQAPAWFTADWPRVPLDGELWAGRGQFERTASIIRDAQPDDAAWRKIRFMVFDLPLQAGPFDQRLRLLSSLLSQISSPCLRSVAQFKVRDEAALNAVLLETVSMGGEGLVLHLGSAEYHGYHSDDLLKLKPYQDAEARVVGHLPGKGKYESVLGALEVEREDGLRFRIGTGFTDEQRRHPPPLESWITYSYQGLTSRGVPRFARFLRVRE